MRRRGEVLEEQREILIAGESARFDPERHKVIRRQCVDYGACWLKNIYFRGDEAFYRELGQTLEDLRVHPGLKARLQRLTERAGPTLASKASRALPAGTPLGNLARRLKKRIEQRRRPDHP